MTHRPLLHAVCTLAIAAASPISIGDVPEATVASVAIDDMPSDIREITDWALDLFDRAELVLPPLEIRHHGDDSGPCDSHLGIHRSRPGLSVIELCTDEAGPGTEAVVLHELAHAWVDHAVDRTRRDAFRRLRGFEHWRDYEAVPWHENGTEQAAEIIAWGLFDRPRAAVRIHQNTCDDLELGYRTLTGRPPLHGFRDLCPP